MKSIPGVNVEREKDALQIYTDNVTQRKEDRPTTGNGNTTFYGDDREYFNYFKDKNPISYFGFSSLSRMVEFVKAIPKEKQNGDGYETDNPKWYGTRDMSEALKLAQYGWQDGIDQAKRVSDFLTIEHATQRRRSYSVAGGNVNVGKMLSGNPSHMVKKKDKKGSRIIKLFVQNNGLCDITGKSMMMRGLVVCAIVDLLENNGYSCEIIAITTDYASSRTPKIVGAHTVVKLKNAGEKGNLSDIAFGLGHPSIFRRFIFANVKATPELRIMWNTQGYSTEAFNSRYPITEKNTFYIPHLKQNIEGDTFEDQVRNCLQMIKPDGLPIEIGE